ncbi:MAG: hypothetical protein ACLP7A_00165 [Desulfobaccales bacterium]
MPPIELKDQFSSLRTEIIESEKARIDLLKYKLVAVATLGAVGLGVGNYAEGHGFIYAICIIPFVCNYVDLLCFHNSLRILAIGRYLHNHGDPYEKFINTMRPPMAPISLFELEDWVLQWSSVALSGIIALFGIFFYHYSGLTDKSLGPIFIIVGLFGIILPLIILRIYRNRVTMLFQGAKQLNANNT